MDDILDLKVTKFFSNIPEIFADNLFYVTCLAVIRAAIMHQHINELQYNYISSHDMNIGILSRYHAIYYNN